MDSTNLKLNELEVFVAVAESSSFSIAAEVKDLTPPVVSRTIKALEDKLATTLFNRTTRQVSLTDEGRWLLKSARNILEEHQKISPHFQRLKSEVSGDITVDAATPFALHAIIPLLAELKNIQPQLRINLISNEKRTELLESGVDVAIRIGALPDSTMRARKLGTTCRGLYASPEYLNRFGRPVTIQDLTHHHKLGFSEFEQLNRWPVKLDSDEQYHPKLLSTTSNSGETLKQMAKNHLGIVCVSRFTAKHDVEHGFLEPVLQSEWFDEHIPIYAVFYSGKYQSIRIRTFIDFVAEHIQL